MKSYRFNMSIYARPEDVFHVLTDYPNYEKWNPWFNVIEGEAWKGGRFTLKFRSPLALLPLHFEFDQVEEGSILRRRQTGWLRHFIHVERERIMYTRTDGSTLYNTRLTLRGPFAPLIAFWGSRSIRESLKNEALALKAYCEQHHGHLLAPQESKAPGRLKRYQMPDNRDHRWSNGSGLYGPAT